VAAWRVDLLIAEIFILAVFPVLLAFAAGWDIASFTIPNTIPLCLLGTFVIFLLASHMSVGAAGGHLVGGVVGLVVGFTLFALGFVGGGDAKLFACTALWLGLSDLLAYALVASVLGGALTLFLVAARRVPLPKFLARESWLVRLHDAKAGIPYGVALAAGALLVLPQTEVFRLAMAR
jgi:prepilin peptidase CpaA